MSTVERKEAVLVLGMHRSGTSTFARALKAMGYFLGDNMMPATKDNEKGYWEDVDIVQKNEDLLKKFSTSWERPNLLDAGVQQVFDSVCESFRSLIKRKFIGHARIAIKDPRISLLLPLWLPLLKNEGYQVKAILCLRHPLSVASSLSARDEIDPHSSLHIWYHYNFKVLTDYVGELLVVGYENLLVSPVVELQRIYSYLSDTGKLVEQDISEFTNNFLDDSLNHNRIDSRREVEELPEYVSNLYSSIALWQDKPACNVNKLCDLAKIEDDKKGLDYLFGEIVNLKKCIRVDFSKIADYEEKLLVVEKERDQALHIRNLTAEANAALRQESVLARKHIELLERENQFAKNARRELQDTYESYVAQHEKQKLELENRYSAQKLELERRYSSDIQAVTKTVELANQHISNIEEVLSQVKRSTSWKMTLPLRVLGTAVRCLWWRISNEISVKLEPRHQLQKKEDLWIATGKDPQITMEVSRLPVSSGWYRLNLDASPGLKPEIFFDYGAGLDAKNTIQLDWNGTCYSALLRLTKPVVGMRLDPCDSECEFQLNGLSVKSVSHVGVLLSFAYERWAMARRHGMPLSQFMKVVYSRIRKEGLNTFLKKAEMRMQSKGATPDRQDYASWIERYEENYDDKNIENILGGLNYVPTLSIVVPVYNTPEHLLKECMESVIAQSYPNWELCVANDKSSEEHVEKVLNRYSAKDERIKVVHRKGNGHICKASNSALELATGEYVGLLDHDDLLHKDALLNVAKELDQNPDIKLIYTDEDKINSNGERYEPHFKPDWNPELLLSQNYISHLTVIERSVIQGLSGFRPGYEGSQDHDLVLRATAMLEPKQISHIPKVLYHWRAIAGSMALDSSEKEYTTESGMKAVKDCLQHKDVSCKVDPGAIPNTYRIIYALPKHEPRVTLIIPTRDQLAITKQCIDSIVNRTEYDNYEVIIIDNGSESPKTLEYFEEINGKFGISVYRYDHPFNYSAINNFAVDKASGEIIGLINNDMEIIADGWLTEMVSHAARKEVGCVGAMLYYPNDTIQHAGVILGLGGVAGHSHKHFKRGAPGYFGRLTVVQNVSAVTGACLLVRKEIYREVGGLNEENLAVAFNDVDFCMKVRMAGYWNIWTPHAELYHHESLSRGADDNPEKYERFMRECEYLKKQWGAYLAFDPFYSPNLTKAKEDFSLNV